MNSYHPYVFLLTDRARELVRDAQVTELTEYFDPIPRPKRRFVLPDGRVYKEQY